MTQTKNLNSVLTFNTAYLWQNLRAGCITHDPTVIVIFKWVLILVEATGFSRRDARGRTCAGCINT